MDTPTQNITQPDSATRPDCAQATGSVVGGYAIPLTSNEAVWHLTNGNPIDIPRMRLSVMLGVIEAWCAEADLDVRTERDRAYITPRNCTISERGRVYVSQND